ncbi:sensor histidine kinase [Pseudonocardia alni]|uniref:sensor histidine kinase n=1 Tax=Pseudonocardia alni TaxID=33907 RepID=UPI0033F09EBB
MTPTEIRRAAVRLGSQAAGLVAVLVVLLTAVAVVVLVEAQRAQVTAQLDGAIARADDVEDPPASVYLLIRAPDGTLARTPTLPAGVADLDVLANAAAGGDPSAGERSVRDVQYEIATQRRADGVTVQAILDLTANHAERNRLVLTMLVTGLLGLLGAGAAGTWLGYRALAPLSAALALQRRFVADAGHELRTPLTLLGTRAQLLRRRLRRDRAAPEALAEADGVITDAARLTAILEDLLFAADPRGERPAEPVDLVALAEDVGRSAGVPVETAGPVVVQGTPAALTRALTALTDNAVRHARTAATLSVSAVGDRAVVDVTDDGAGVDPDVLPRLFERFATGARPTDPGRRRYGIGLALVTEIAAGHGGRVELVPTATGAHFRLTLPLEPDPHLRP